MTWKRIMLEAEQTQVAAALPGIPLDESYARYAAQMQQELESAGPAGTAVASSQPIPTPGKSAMPTRPRNQRLASVSEDEAVVIRRRDTSGPILGVFHRIFGFGSDNERPVRTKRRKTGTILFGATNSEASAQIKRLRTRDR